MSVPLDYKRKKSKIVPPPPKKKKQTNKETKKKHLESENSQNCLMDGVKWGWQALVRHSLLCFNQVNSHFLSIAHRHTG